MWKKLALGLALFVAVAGVVIATRPATFEVERSALVQAPPDVVFAQIQNLRAMDTWSPYAQMDPQMKIRYEGPEAGVGARSSWEGPQMGTGSLTVTAVEPGRSVDMALDMLTPLEAHNQIRFSLTPEAQGTRVTWRMQGASGFLGKAIHLVVDMDDMVGGQFEQGLAALTEKAEAEAVALAPARASSR
ncbi:MAG TPA: SRPBCC family protein [Myxococcota bacterium]|nr:SRPBCC family protein [Myxococcota bacterium]